MSAASIVSVYFRCWSGLFSISFFQYSSLICCAGCVICGVYNVICRANNVTCKVGFVICKFHNVVCRVGFVTFKVNNVVCREGYVRCKVNNVVCWAGYVVCWFNNVIFKVNFAICRIGFVTCVAYYVHLLVAFRKMNAGVYSVDFLVQFYRHYRHIIIYNFYLCICKNTA